MAILINDTTPRNQYTATASQTVFTYAFEIFEDSDIVVDQNGTILTLSTHYTVQNAGVTGGGTITLVTGATVGDIITLYRDVPTERLTDYQTSGDFLAETVNDDFDRIITMVQQTEEVQDRSIQLPVNDSTGVSVELPTPEALRPFRWNAGLTGLENYDQEDPAEVITYTPPFTGSQIRTVESRLSDSVSVLDFGATGDGVTDDTAAVQAALDTGAGVVHVPDGTYLVNSASLSMSDDQTLQGSHAGSAVLKFQATVGNPAFGGIAMSSSRVTIRDLGFSVDDAGQSWCAAIFVNGNSDNVHIENCRFVGVTTKLNNWGIWVNGGGLNGLHVRDCYFELLDLPIAKDNSDTSGQTDTSFVNCRFYDCTDGVNINSPAGSWKGVTVTNCYFDTMAQFPVAFAGNDCEGSNVTGCTFTDVEYEGLHYEAGTHGHHASGNTFRLCNKTAGTVGSGAAVNGSVQIITGSYDIHIESCSFDLTQNTTGTPNGICVQAGGGDNPHDIWVSGCTFLCKSGTIGVFAQNVGQTGAGALDISSCTFENQAASKSSKLMELPFTMLTGGNNRFINPGIVLEVDNNSYGGLSNSGFFGDLSTLDFLNGSTNSATSVVFNGIRLQRDFDVDAAATWQDICPAGSLYDGICSIRYIGNGASDSFTKTAKLDADSGTLNVTTEQFNVVGGIGLPVVAPDIRENAGVLQARAFRATTQNGQILFTFDGPFYP